MRITAHKQEIGEVRLRVETSDFRTFSVKVSKTGFEFHGDIDCNDNAIKMSVDDLFDWVKNKKPKGRNAKLFQDRAALRPKPPQPASHVNPKPFKIRPKVT